MKKQFLNLTAIVLAAAGMGAAMADVPDHHHHHFAKDVDTFHAALAPIWHARPGPDRLPNACAKVDELGGLASAIRSSDASKLVASIATMKSACQGKLGDVDAAFYDVHEAFHNLIEAKPTPAKR